MNFKLFPTLGFHDRGHCFVFFMNLHIYDEKWTAWAMNINFSLHISKHTLFEYIAFLSLDIEKYT